MTSHLSELGNKVVLSGSGSTTPSQQLTNPMQLGSNTPLQHTTNPMQQLTNPMQMQQQLTGHTPMQQQLTGHTPMQQQLTGHTPMQQLTNSMQMHQLNNPMQMQQLSNPLHQHQHAMPLQEMGPGSRSYYGNSVIPSSQKLIKNDRNPMMMASDDNVMMKQVYENHLPDGRDVDVKPLLHIVEDILKRACLSVVEGTQGENLEEKSQHSTAIFMLDSLSHIIDKVSCEMAIRCLSGGDGHATAVSIFHMVASYPWDAKLVLTLAAFALNYGEFWLLAQIYSSNQLARSMAILKQVPSIMEHSGPLKPRFDALNKLIQSVLELTRVIVLFKDLPPMHITPDVPAMASAMATIPTAVYWNVRSIIACATQITSLTSMGHEYAISSTELAWELSNLSHKINHILEFLRQQLTNCHRLIEEKRENEAKRSLHQLFDTIHIDNMKVLKSLIYSKDDLLPLVDGSTKRRVSLEVLRRKNVLLLISGLDMSRDELSILEQIYSESRIHATRMESMYEVVWLPIVDPSVQWTEELNKQFEEIRSTMPWYTVHHPSLIDHSVIRFIPEKWHFRNKPILVVLDPQGRELSPNAIHMMWIWGSNAFPFTSLREEALWREETWRLELLVSGMDPTILNWIREDKYIFLYGGDDIEWIRKFTTTARAVATAARIPLEMAYVGKSNKREQVRRATAAITVEKLSYCWQDPAMIWFFWTRLESMLYSKIQLRKADDQDPVMQEIKKLLSYDKDGSWAVLCKGSTVVAVGHGGSMLPALSEYDSWKEQVAVKGFEGAFKEYHSKLHVASHNCCRFEFPVTAGRIPDNMRCPECQRLMEKFIAFLCCHDETAMLAPYA